MGPDTPGTFTPREERKGWPLDQFEAFFHMQQLGADLIDATIACVTGHRMTPDLAALCITTYWRRYAAIANYQESRGAAITIQARAAPRIRKKAFPGILWAKKKAQRGGADRWHVVPPAAAAVPLPRHARPRA